MKDWTLKTKLPDFKTPMGPETVPLGTVAEICVSEVAVNVALLPLANWTAETPLKPEPWMTTISPGLAKSGEKELMTWPSAAAADKSSTDRKRQRWRTSLMMSLPSQARLRSYCKQARCFRSGFQFATAHDGAGLPLALCGRLPNGVNWAQLRHD